MTSDVYYQTPDHRYLSCPSFPSMQSVFTLISLTRPTILAFFKTWFIAPASGIFGLIKNLLSPCFIRLIKAVVPVGAGSRDCWLPPAVQPLLEHSHPRFREPMPLPGPPEFRASNLWISLLNTQGRVQLLCTYYHNKRYCELQLFS